MGRDSEVLAAQPNELDREFQEEASRSGHCVTRRRTRPNEKKKLEDSGEQLDNKHSTDLLMCAEVEPSRADNEDAAFGMRNLGVEKLASLWSVSVDSFLCVKYSYEDVCLNSDEVLEIESGRVE